MKKILNNILLISIDIPLVLIIVIFIFSIIGTILSAFVAFVLYDIDIMLIIKTAIEKILRIFYFDNYYAACYWRAMLIPLITRALYIIDEGSVNNYGYDT